MNNEKDDSENLRCAYSEVNHHHRHYSNLRFAAFALYFVVLGGLLYFSYGGGTKLSSLSWWTLISRTQMMALLLTAVFFAFEIFCELTMRQLREIARELEEALGLHRFSRAGSFSTMLWASYFIWAVYAMFILFWLVVQSSPPA
jgi:hypothetical protein